MGKSCPAYNCVSRDSVENRRNGLSFHRFPKDPKLRMIWIRAVCRKNPKTGEIWQPHRHSVLCSKHFREEMFDRASTVKVRLHKHAVPEIFDGIPKHLQMKRERLFKDIESNEMDQSQSAKTELHCTSSDELSQSSVLRNQKHFTKSPSFTCKESDTSESEESSSKAELTKHPHIAFVKVLKDAEVVDSAAEYTDEQHKDSLSQAHSLKSQSAVKNNKADSSSEDEAGRPLSRKELKNKISVLEAKLAIQTTENKLLRACNRRLQREVQKLRSGRLKTKSQLLSN